MSSVAKSLAKPPAPVDNKWTALDVAIASKAQLFRVIAACERALFPQLLIGEVENNVWIKREFTADDMRSLAVIKLRECQIKQVLVPDLPDVPDISLRAYVEADDLFSSECP